MALESGTRLGHYQVVSSLGAGGMGEVYRARDTKLGREVAIKVLPAKLSQNMEHLARFEREARAIAALNHPNIVTVHSVEQAGGVHFITMELVRGKTLSELQAKKAFSLDKFFDIAIPLADAVAAAHQEGITHRDLKPDNVMVTEAGRPKVLDFGLSKPESTLGTPAGSESPTELRTREGTIAGTLHYMSPEQADGKVVDPRSDIFSLGILFYEMLTGSRPFTGDGPAQILSSILRDEPRSVTELNPAVPRDLANLIRRCLAKEPTRRIQSALDVRNSLEETNQALDSGEMLESGRIGHASSWSRWLKMTAAVGVVMTVLLIGWTVRGLLPSSSDLIPRLINPVQVTSSVGVEDHPAWSPDGRTLAYTGSRSSNLFWGNWDIWVTQGGGTPSIDRTAEYAGDDRYPTWSPDGRRIAFWSDRDGGGYYVMPALAGAARRVAPGPPQMSASSAQWSADGNQDLWMLPANGGEMQQLTTEPTPDWSPRWSPDGQTIAFYSYRSGSRDIWVIPAGGGSAQRVTEHDALDLMPVWSPDGRELLFASLRSGNMDIWSMSLESGDTKQITTHPAADTDLALSPDGEHLVFTSDRSGSIRLWWKPLNGGDPMPLAGNFAHASRWSRDGKKVYYPVLEATGGNLWAVSVEDGSERPITNFSGKPGNLGAHGLATDGNYLYFTWEEDLGDIWVMDVENQL